MKVGIVHYHLRPGGVTRVIELAWAALAGEGIEALVISGEPQPEGGRIPDRCVRVVPELAYGKPANAGAAGAVDRVCREFWGSMADVLHVHNSSLGKNAATPAAVAKWAVKGRALLLQMHDFAENCRPANYRMLCDAFGGRKALDKVLYPFSDRVRPVCLTSGAASRLGESHPEILPNPVDLPPERVPFRPPGDKLLVYPTRGIPRKNLGEALLHAALAEPGERLVVTSAPAGGVDLMAYQDWQAFSESLNLPVIFDASKKFQQSVYSLLEGADECLTTSVEEGFGMAFLEPWACGKGLTGRNLPAVTADFRDSGVNLDSLYDAWQVPCALFDVARAKSRIFEACSRLLTAYQLPADDRFSEEAIRAVFSGDTADFGRLDAGSQREVLKKASGLPKPSANPEIREVIDSNRQAIQENYSLAAYGKSLHRLLQTVASASNGPANFLEASQVLQRILTPVDYSGLRSVS